VLRFRWPFYWEKKHEHHWERTGLGRSGDFRFEHHSCRDCPAQRNVSAEVAAAYTCDSPFHVEERAL